VNVLFIGCGFHEYDQIIYGAIKKLYTKVQYLKLTEVSRLTNYENYDLILCVKGDFLSERDLDNLKLAKARKILYFWDSLSNMRLPPRIFEAFDQIKSFDLVDCRRSGFEFLPLFSSYFEPTKHKRDYSAYFLGTDHSGRYEFFNRLHRQLKKNGLNPHFHIVTKKWRIDKYFLNKVAYPNRLTYSQYMKNICNSRVVIDISSPNQTGASMRCIEALVNGAGLLTTNEHIKDHDFYDPEVIKTFSLDESHASIYQKLISIDSNYNFSHTFARFRVDEWIIRLLSK
jgi:hypothetical protein